MEILTNMVEIWENEFSVASVKYVKALNSHFILIERENILSTQQYIANSPKERGIYYIEVDFDELETTGGKLPTYIQSGNLKSIDESVTTGFSRITRWEAKGNSKILAVSFAIERSPGHYETKLMALTNPSGTFDVCDSIDYVPQVRTIELILPFDDVERAYVLYGTENGLDGGRH